MCALFMAIVETKFFKKNIFPIVMWCFAILAIAGGIIYVIKGIIWVVFIIIAFFVKLFS